MNAQIVKVFARLPPQLLHNVQSQSGGLFLCAETGLGLVVNDQNITTIANSGKKTSHSVHHDLFKYDKINDRWICQATGFHSFTRVDTKTLKLETHNIININDKNTRSRQNSSQHKSNYDFKDNTDKTFQDKEQNDVGTGAVDCAQETSGVGINYKNGDDVYELRVPHIIVIGNTGVGKSSLIKLLTNSDDIKIADADDPESCTTTTTGYQFDLGIGAREFDEVKFELNSIEPGSVEERIYTKKGQLAYI